MIADFLGIASLCLVYFVVLAVLSGLLPQRGAASLPPESQAEPDTQDKTHATD